MISKKTCRKCGAPLGAGARSNFCPACLYAELIVESAGHDDATLSASNVDTASPDETSFVSSSPVGPSHRFGDYELLQEIARGGMGIVYKARQRSLHRIVAVKMILAGQFAGKHLIQRFRGEVTAAALLQHPNIVAIHEVGIHEGQHFFSMDYVEGQNLAQLVGNRPRRAT